MYNHLIGHTSKEEPLEAREGKNPLPAAGVAGERGGINTSQKVVVTNTK